MRLFDLNIETVLEHWDVEHGLREIIANALDERMLTSTPPISISKDDQGRWHIRDFGRGIRIEHFTLNENLEKIGADGVIGKFGVGLKDALATLDRHHAKVSIRSQHGIFTLTKAAKHDFDGITTLHISHEPGDQTISGTDVTLTNIPDAAIAKAKSMFLCFREHRVLESTPFGQIIAAAPAGAEVFINSVWVNAEPSFMFSYNVTSLTDSMRKSLNRERVNVGRSVYADRLRQILKCATAATILQQLASAYERRDEGEMPEELRWIDISHRALNELAKAKNVVVLSQKEIKARSDLVEDIKRDGRQIVLLTDREKQRADEQAEQGKAPFQTLHTWIQSVNDSFQYQFVDEIEFTDNENSVWQRRNQILWLIGLRPNAIPRIRISETMCTSADGTTGVWDSKLNAVVIKRTQLRSLQAFAGTLLHELAHVTTGAGDCTRFFENTLTEYLGKVAAITLLSATPLVDHYDVPKSNPIPPASITPFDLNGITFVPVESSCIAGVSYNDQNQTLYVAFKDRKLYAFQAVPQTEHIAFINSPSKGRYLSILFDRYKYGSI
jgi:hypothetical protein